MQRIPARDLKAALAILACAAGLASCESAGQQCYTPINISVQNSFFLSWPDSLKEPDGVVNGDTVYIYIPVTELEDTALASPQLKVIGEDSVYLSVLAGARSLRCLLNPAKDSIRYSFGVNSEVDTLAFTDTITYYYTPSVHFISNSCGYTYYYELTGVKSTYHEIDSIAIANRAVTQDLNTSHVRIIFKRQ